MSAGCGAVKVARPIRHESLCDSAHPLSSNPRNVDTARVKRPPPRTFCQRGHFR